MPKKLIFVALALLLYSAKPAFAQSGTNPNEFIQDFATENQTEAGSNLGKFNTQNINRVAGSLLFSISGGKAISSSLSSYDQYYGQGMIPTAVTYTASLFDRPVKTSIYVADVLKNTNLVPQAYAQGIGFVGLNPVLNIWKAFRNIAYLAFIVIFVVIGFMIMLRKKISSNTVVTIQEALPKIIVTLLLITFSYAIAGLMVDIMYLSIFVLTGILQASGLITDAAVARNTLFTRNVIGIGISYFTGFTEASGMAAEALGQLVSQVFGGLIGGAANVVFYLIFAVAILIAVFRTFIQLTIAYIGIIISTIFAPLQLLPNAFPGSDAFQKWLRGLFANVAVFPVASAMIFLGLILCGDRNGNPDFAIPPSGGHLGFSYEGFLPPLLHGQAVSNGGSVNAVQVIIGFGIIMLLPEVVKITKETLQVKESAFGEAAWKNAMQGKGIIDKPAGFIGGIGKTGLSIATGAVTQTASSIYSEEVRSGAGIIGGARNTIAKFKGVPSPVPRQQDVTDGDGERTAATPPPPPPVRR